MLRDPYAAIPAVPPPGSSPLRQTSDGPSMQLVQRLGHPIPGPSSLRGVTGSGENARLHRAAEGDGRGPGASRYRSSSRNRPDSADGLAVSGRSSATALPSSIRRCPMGSDMTSGGLFVRARSESRWERGRPSSRRSRTSGRSSSMKSTKGRTSRRRRRDIMLARSPLFEQQWRARSACSGPLRRRWRRGRTPERESTGCSRCRPVRPGSLCPLFVWWICGPSGSDRWRRRDLMTRHPLRGPGNGDRRASLARRADHACFSTAAVMQTSCNAAIAVKCGTALSATSR